MSKRAEVTRKFRVPDDVMLQASRVMHGIFLEDKDTIINFDADFNTRFAENWNAKNKEALEISNDNYYIDKLTEYTAIVQGKMDRCRTAFQKMKYFIEKAFPNQTQIWNQFGFNDYNNVRKSEAHMIKFMGILHSTAIIHADTLIAAGFSRESIDEIEILQEELKNADYEQEMFKKKRSKITQDRVIILNECYEYMQKVSKAAKVIFADNYVKYNNYLLPSETPVKETVPEEEEN